ncbi:MAG: hypothetical protein V3V12_00505 [Gammaproteobacteria bacterium]
MKAQFAKIRVNFVELLLLVSVLFFVGSLAIPRMQATPQSPESALSESMHSIRSAHANAIEKLQRFPTIEELSVYINDVKTYTRFDGIELPIQGNRLTIPTFVDASCTQPTESINDEVACIGKLSSI